MKENTIRFALVTSMTLISAIASYSAPTAAGVTTTTGESVSPQFQPGQNRGDDKQAAPKEDVERVHSAAEIDKMQKYLDTRIDRSGIYLSLKTGSGRKVDCVDIYLQPALKNPALRGHTLQRVPNSPLLTVDLNGNASKNIMEPLFEIDANGGTKTKVTTCPDGTVPIPEVTAKDLHRFSSLQDFFAKIPSHLRQNAQSMIGAAPDLALPIHYGPTSQHQYAHAYRYVTNWGASANVNIWNPYTELNSEFSLSQIWVVGGSGNGLQTLEVGTQKYHNLYGNDNPHLFIYSTRDGYRSTGCYNNTCGDFVQVSSSIYPGASINGSSVYNGTQYEMSMQWFKDMDGGAWWLNVQGQWVGYYPRALYNTSGVINHAAEIDFGGEIIDNRNLNSHTATDMGSGSFPSAGWRKAAYQRLLRYNYKTTANPNTVWYTDATGLTTSRSDAACYDITYYTGDPNWGAYFYFGGPGYSYSNCH